MKDSFKVKFLRLVDFLMGRGIVLFLMPFKIIRDHAKREPKKILAIRLWGLGSAVLNAPAIKAIKECYPDSTLTVLEGDRIKGIFEHYRFTDEIYTMNITLINMIRFIFRNFRKFDLAVDFEEYFSSSTIIAFLTGKKAMGFRKGLPAALFDLKVNFNDRQYIVETYLDLVRALQCKSGKGLLIYPEFSPEKVADISSRLKTLGINNSSGRFVGFCAGAAESTRERMWPVENFSSLADYIIEKHNADIVLVGSEGETGLNEKLVSETKNSQKVLNLSGKLNIEDLFFIMKKFLLFVTNDTGPMHVAGATGIPIVAFFGPNLPLRYAPRGKNVIVCYETALCSPCIHAHRGIFPDCKKENKGECMKMISVDSAKNAVDKLLSDADKI
jgi:heptosyltransferase-2